MRGTPQGRPRHRLLTAFFAQASRPARRGGLFKFRLLGQTPAFSLAHVPGKSGNRFSDKDLRKRNGRQGDHMKPTLRPGIERVKRIAIGDERTISFMGEGARTYATPSMIRDIEHTCRELILEHADAGEDSVGMEVAVKHLAPTLMGMTVEIAVRVTAVDGRKVLFEATVTDQLDTVGLGTHARFVIDKDKTFDQLKAKAARFAARSG